MNIPWKTLAGGISMPELGQGTWRLGGVSERDPGNDDARDVAVIRRALDAGLIHIDTAEMYAGGHAEELVGKRYGGWSVHGSFSPERSGRPISAATDRCARRRRVFSGSASTCSISTSYTR